MTRTVSIGVGDRSIPWSSLEPSADRKRVVRVHHGTAHEIGSATEHVRVFEDGDRQVLERTQILDSPELGNRVDTTVVVRDTFAPVRYRSVQGGERVEVAYGGALARLRRIRNGIVAEAREVELGTDVFDAHAIELVLRLLPLHAAYRVTLPAFDAHSGAMIQAVVEVLGSEPVDDGAGALPAWTVGLSWQAHHQRYWVSMEGAGIVRQTVRLHDGALIAFIR